MPNQGVQTPPVPKCSTCGGDLAPGAIWCKNCELFQADEAQTCQCPQCGLYVPRAAKKCYKCGGVVGARKWVDFSSVSVGALTGLASALTLLVGSINTFYDKHKSKLDSQTTVVLTYVDELGRELVAGTRNVGQKYSAILEMQLLVSVYLNDRKRAEFTEELYVDSERRPGLALSHSDYIQLHRLVPASAPHLWNLAASLVNAPEHPDEDTRKRISDQLLREGSQLTAHCALQYVVQESSSDKIGIRPADQGNEKWTPEKCKKFLQVAYSGH
jgi:hypothetical protein